MTTAVERPGNHFAHITLEKKIIMHSESVQVGKRSTESVQTSYPPIINYQVVSLRVYALKLIAFNFNKILTEQACEGCDVSSKHEKKKIQRGEKVFTFYSAFSHWEELLTANCKVL